MNFKHILCCIFGTLLFSAACSDDKTEGGGNPNPPVLNAYDITVSEDFDTTLGEILVDTWAEPGEEVRVTITVLNYMLRVGSVTYNDKEAAFVSRDEDQITYVYSFTMPEEDVEINAVIDMNYYTITKKNHAHARLTPLNVLDDPDNPATSTYSQVPTAPVYFIHKTDRGWTESIKITGDESKEDVAFVWTEEGPADYGRPCWSFTMPFEPVTIEITATEKTDFLGKPFTGEYKGHAIAPGSSQIVASSNPALTLNLSSNTSFRVKSTDAEKYDVEGCYFFDEATNTFRYDPEYIYDEYDEPTFGIEGTWFEGDYAFVRIKNLKEPKPANTRYYFVGDKSFDYVCAANNEYATEARTLFLIEAKNGGKSTYYYVERMEFRPKVAQLRFLKGSSINGESDVIVSFDGEAQLRYTYTPGSTPVFRERGSEAGSYSGSEGQLTLDGLGIATLAGKEGFYEIKGTVITCTFDGKSSEYVLDTTAKTYTAITSGEWDGPKEFSLKADGSKAFHGGEASTAEIKLLLDSDFSGNETKGSYKLTVLIGDCQLQAIARSNSYTYNPVEGTILLSKVYNGKNTTTGGFEYVDLLLNVSSDKQTLTFADNSPILRTTTTRDEKHPMTEINGSNTYVVVAGLSLGTGQQGGEVSDPWDGKETYMYMGYGTCMDKQTMTTMQLKIYTDGSCNLLVQMMHPTTFQNVDIVHSDGTFTYDAAAGKLTLHLDEAGTAEGGIAPFDLPLEVSANSLTVTEVIRLYTTGAGGTSAQNTYVDLKGVAFTGRA